MFLIGVLFQSHTHFSKTVMFLVDVPLPHLLFVNTSKFSTPTPCSPLLSPFILSASVGF